MTELKTYQKDFIEFALESKALRFGDFTLKSGRKSPFFFNIGNFHQGKALRRLSSFYAQAIKENFPSFDILFGPSYKGIPLSVSTVMALSEIGVEVSYSPNRKESKDHGEKGVILGHPLEKDDRIVLIDDVVTSGLSVDESLSLIHDISESQVIGLVVSLDRKEKSLDSDHSALRQIGLKNNIHACAIVDIDQAIAYIKESHPEIFAGDLLDRVLAYRKEFGSRD